MSMVGAGEYGPWRPLAIDEVAQLFRATRDAGVSPAVGRSNSSSGAPGAHDDVDVSVLRQEAKLLYRLLRGWDVHVAAGGQLTPWDGRELVAVRGETTLWCRRTPTAPWCLDLTIGDGDANRWVYRRTPTLTAPWSDAVRVDGAGVPYLAPELQLLFESKDVREKDEVDARRVIPALSQLQHAWLARALPPAHPWHAFVASR